MRKAAIWLRVSTDEQAEGDSLRHHEYRATAYAEAKGWEVCEVYRLEGVSGWESISGSEGQRMLADIRAGKIDVLIFSKLARLARNTRHLLEVADVFQQHKADLVSIEESIDTSTPAGRLFYTILAAFAEWERFEIAARIKASVPIRAKMGKSTGGPPPYGYQWVDSRLELNDNEAPIRLLIYDLFLEHKSYLKVAKILNERKIDSRTEAGWTDPMIKGVITDPVGYGKRIVNFTGKSEDQWIEQDVPALIDKAKWDACQEIVKGKVRKGRGPQHLFAGVTHCECGRKIYTDHVSKAYRCRACKIVIKAEDLEREFANEIIEFFSSDDKISLIDNESARELQSKRNYLELKKRELERLVKEKKLILNAFVSGNLAESEFGQYSSDYTAKIEAAEKEVATTEGQISYLINQSQSTAETAIKAQEILKHWNLFTEDEKRSIADKLINKITVGADYVRFVIGHPSKLEKSNETQDPFDFSKPESKLNIAIKSPRKRKKQGPKKVTRSQTKLTPTC